MKDTDLIVMNMNNKKVIKIQVKGSRAYEPSAKETIKYWDGSTWRFYLKKETIYENKSDFFIFLVYVIEENETTWRRLISPHTLTIPTQELIALCEKYKNIDKSNKYSFYFWVNPKNNISFDFRNEIYDVSKYLNKRWLNQLNKELI